jgi:hypothetical protein
MLFRNSQLLVPEQKTYGFEGNFAQRQVLCKRMAEPVRMPSDSSLLEYFSVRFLPY